MQRRFPKGLKVHVHSLDRFGCLAALARVLHQVRRQRWGNPAGQSLLASKQGGLAAAQQDSTPPGHPAPSRLFPWPLSCTLLNLAPCPGGAQAGLSVTRAKVRTYATSKSSGHTFYVMDAKGGPPDK